MKAILRTSDNIAVYLFNDGDEPVIKSSGLHGPVRALDVKPDTHQIVEDVPPPDLWVGNALAYDAGWQIVDQDAITEKLEALKEQKQDERKQARQAAINAGFEHGGVLVNSDLESRSLILGLFALAQAAIAEGTQAALDQYAATLGAGFRGANDVIVAADAPGMIALAQSLAAHIAACDANSESIKAAIAAASDFAELASIDVTAGYPAAEAV